MSIQTNIICALALNRVCFGFTLLRSVIGYKEKLAPLSQTISSNTKTNPDLLARFSRVFSLASDWFAGLFTFVVINQSNWFDFGFATFN